MMHIAFLRGINVGGKAVLPMQALASAFTAAGAQAVQTYIQSGNVLFQSESPEPVVAVVTRQIAAAYGYPGRIVLRSVQDLRTTYQNNPFADAPAASLHVYFLAGQPAPEAVAALDPRRSPGDSFLVCGRDIYLHLPQGMAATSLTMLTSTASCRPSARPGTGTR